MKYIFEWENANIAQTREGEYGISHICSNDLNGLNDFDVLCKDRSEELKEKLCCYIFKAIFNQLNYRQTYKSK